MVDLNFATLDGLWWLLLILAPFLFFQRQLHFEIQSILLLLTKRSDLSIACFSILFFPGVLLHESSHYLMARLLQVRTGRLSLIPRPLSDGRVQLGYVETAKADIFRDALIGIAPLVAGGIMVAYAGMIQLGLSGIWDGNQNLENGMLIQAFQSVYRRSDFWLWFYLIFTVSSTMMPSKSDRRAWLPVTLAAILLIGIGLFAGAGPWLVQNLAQPFNRALRSVSAVFSISLVIHLVLVIPMLIIRRILERLTGYRVS